MGGGRNRARPLVALLGVGWIGALASACFFGGASGPVPTPVPTPILMQVGSPTPVPVVVREVTVLATVIQTVVHTVVVTAPAASPTSTPIVVTPGPPPLLTSPAVEVERRLGTPQVFATTGDQPVRIAVSVNAVAELPAGGSLRQPAGRWVLVDWTVRNEGDRPYRLNTQDVKLQTAEGYVIRADPTAGQREPLLLDDTLGPGQAVRGVLAYDIPAGQALRAAIFQPPSSPQLVVADLSR